MSRIPLVEARRRRTIRKRLARKAALAERLAKRVLPTPEPISKTRARKLEREENRIQERDRKKAEHKLAFLDRLFGIGRGPVSLRMKWLDKLLGK